jgi:hypothetical protein
VMSSIAHREQARLYVKPVHAGKSEFDLSPEENEAIQHAMSEGESREQVPLRETGR